MRVRNRSNSRLSFCNSPTERRPSFYSEFLRVGPRRPKSEVSAPAECKPGAWPRQKPKHGHAATDPLVNPGNPPHRDQTRAKADPTRTRHHMVTLAQSSPGRRSACAFQSEQATVMLGLLYWDLTGPAPWALPSDAWRSRAAISSFWSFNRSSGVMTGFSRCGGRSSTGR
jgi:hypothetical protein